MAALNKNTPVSNSEEDDSFFDYLNSLSPLKTKKYDGVGATETLNSLGMDYSLITSLDVTFYNKSIFLKRNNLLDKSNPEVSSKDVNKIYSLEEAPTNSTHEWIDNSELPDPQFSSDDLKFLLGIIDGPEPIDAGAYIREDNRSQPISAVDRNPVERVDDELARIRRGIQRSCQGYASEKPSLQRNNFVYTSNNSSCTTKSDERNAFTEKPLLPGKHTSDSLLTLNQYKGKENEKMSTGRKLESPSKGISYRRSPALMERTGYVQFRDITNKPLDQNRKRTMKVRGKGLINPTSSGSNHEKEEESADLCQSIPQRKRKVHKSDLTREDGACKNCRCKKSKCLKRYCECFAAGVYCTGPCKCQDCSNKPINKDTSLQAPTEIESGKPLAFVPKVVSDLTPQSEIRK